MSRKSISRSLFFLIFPLFLMTLLSSCVVERRDSRQYRLPREDRPLRGGSGPQVERYGWEAWPSERDLDGLSLRNAIIIRGDEFVDEGNRKDALAEYLRVKPEDLTLGERDALTLRVASTQLSLRQAKKSLATISSYFRSSGKSVEDADPYFSLVLGYGYAAIDDVDQSFAWLSRANRTGARQITASNAARLGVSRIAQSLAPDEIEAVADAWRADSFVSGILGQERRRRSYGGPIVALGEQKEGLYEKMKIALTLDGDGNYRDGGSTESGYGSLDKPTEKSGTIVGVILPLTGKFAALGANAKNGVELALSASVSPAITPIFKDDGGASGQSVAIAQDLSNLEHAAFILGPLLSESAEAVAQMTSEASSPVITYSKKEVFAGGRGAFRLGATSSSQVRSLFNAIETKLGLKKLAVVYPDDESGREFGRLFKEAAQQRGMNLAYEGGYRRTDPDGLLKVASEVEGVQPDGIFFPDNIIEATRFFTALKPAIRQAVVPLGPASWDNEAQLNRSKNVLEGAVFVSPFFAASRKEIIVRFVEAYQARYKTKPDFLAAQAFDSATLALAALRKQISDGISFSQALTAVERYEGLTGTIQVQPSGEIDRNFEIVTLSQGALVELQKRLPDTFIARGNTVIEQ